MLGISVWIDEQEIEKEIFRLTASVALADVELNKFVDEGMTEGVALAKKNIQNYVYAIPQGPNTTYERTFKLLNSVKSGKINRAGATARGQIYISREPFGGKYYPVYVEYGYDAGAPYQGRGYWAITVAELKAGLHLKSVRMGRRVSAKMVK